MYSHRQGYHTRRCSTVSQLRLFLIHLTASAAGRGSPTTRAYARFSCLLQFVRQPVDCQLRAPRDPRDRRFLRSDATHTYLCRSSSGIVDWALTTLTSHIRLDLALTARPCTYGPYGARKWALSAKSMPRVQTRRRKYKLNTTGTQPAPRARRQRNGHAAAPAPLKTPRRPPTCTNQLQEAASAPLAEYRLTCHRNIP